MQQRRTTAFEVAKFIFQICRQNCQSFHVNKFIHSCLAGQLIDLPGTGALETRAGNVDALS